MENVGHGTAAFGLMNIGVGLLTVSEWCAVIGVVLTFGGMLVAHLDRKRQSKAQTALLLAILGEIKDGKAPRSSDASN